MFLAMQKEIKETLTAGNQGGTMIDVLKSDNVKENETKTILRENGQGNQDYFLYHSISKF